MRFLVSLERVIYSHEVSIKGMRFHTNYEGRSALIFSAAMSGAACTATNCLIAAVHVLNNDVRPFFESHNVRLSTVLSDTAESSSGARIQYPYELFLQLEEIEHRTIKVHRPQSNCFFEQLRRILLDEHFRIQGRTKWHEAMEEMQTDLDDYLVI